ncbi:MAG: sigma-70 family RNA polymerase sigma factor [Tepidiformaceae bacterium]
MEHPIRADGMALTAQHAGIPLSAEQLCVEYSDRVYRFAAMISRGDVEAEDLAQEALERAIRYLPSFDPARGAVEGWLWRTVLNAARDAGRAAKRRHLLVERLRSLRGPDPTPAIEIPDAVLDETIVAGLRALGPRDRTLLALRFGADLDHREIGRALGLSEEAAGVAGRRALAKLRKRVLNPTEELSHESNA